MPARSHVGWGFVLSLLLHATGIAVLSLALPRLNVKPGVLRQIDFAVLSEPAEAPNAPKAAAAAAAQPARPDEPMTSAVAVEVINDPTAAIELSPAPILAPKPAPIAAPKPARKAPIQPLSAAPPTARPTQRQLTAAVPSKLPATPHPNPRSDGSVLERVLRQIAATSELSQDERRRAMLIVLRTWEDPSGKRSAEELIDALLERVRQSPDRSPQP
jgi:hypothetical protein